MQDQSMAIIVKNLNYDYGGARQVLFDVSFSLPKGSRCILVGANGTGKSTLMRIIAGKHKVGDDNVTILGKNPFYENPQGLAFLGGQWGRSTNYASYLVPYQADIPVSKLIESADGHLDIERTNYLIDMLDVNTDWRMHEVSDGQRRRVQILLGLMKPFDILLLDEVTTDLDVLVRKNLLDYLKNETETRGTTIIYATHIFDGLNEWASDLIHLSNGKLLRNMKISEIKELSLLKQDTSSSNSPLLRLVESWIKEESDEKRKLKIQNQSEKEANKPGPVLQKFSDNADRKKSDRFFNYWG